MANGAMLFTFSRNFAANLPGLRNKIITIGTLNKRWLCAAPSQKQSTTADPAASNTSNTDSATVTPSTDAASTDAASTDAASTDADTQKNEEFTKEIEKLNNDLAELKDKYQRSLADRENVRRRLEKQVSDAKLYGIQGFCKDLLEVTDVFRKALESVTPEQLSEGSEQLRSLYDGVSMTETQLLAVFRRNGLSVMPLDSGAKFDTSWHEAVFEVPSDGKNEPGTIAHILRPAWKLHERCIRSAQVGVIKE